ncbi:MAG: hypothetical protein WDZ38_01205 [Balneolaceae bacterium]
MSIPHQKRILLITLRGSSLFLLILLLFNPYLLLRETIDVKPSIAVYYDNSRSMSVARGDYSGSEDYQSIVDRFSDSMDNLYEYTQYLFGESIQENSEISLSDTRTNLAMILEHLRERENQYSAAIIFSDGIITQGRNPVFAAQNLTIPVITVPVGDTTSVRDIAISNVTYTSSVYSNTRQTIVVEISQEGFENEIANLQFMKDGDLIETTAIQFGAVSSSHQIEFAEEFNEPGFYEYELFLPPKPEEFSTQNNRTQFTIEVLDDKTRILSLAFEIHPDVGSVRRVIATDQQNELITSIYLENGIVLGDDPFAIDQDLDLIVLHGLPPEQSGIRNWLQNHQTPLLFLLTPNTFERVSHPDLLDLTGFFMDEISSPMDIQIDPFENTLSHPILEFDHLFNLRFPVLQTMNGSYQLSQLSQPIITALFEREETNLPVIITEDASNIRMTSVTAFGWYKYEQNNQLEIREFYKNLFTNLISWTSTLPDTRNLIISPHKTEYTDNENIEVRAELLNERGEPEPEAAIELEIYERGSAEPLQQVRMNHQQNEIYTSQLGSYPQGIYRVQATALKGDRIIGRAETRVLINESIIEFLNTKRNDQLMRQIAELTGGVILPDSSFSEEITNFLINNVNTDSFDQITEDFYHIHRSTIWFFIILILLSAEWIIRRSVSLP